MRTWWSSALGRRASFVGGGMRDLHERRAERCVSGCKARSNECLTFPGCPRLLRGWDAALRQLSGQIDFVVARERFERGHEQAV